MEISVHWQFQAPGKLHEGATRASWSEFCLVFSFIVFQSMPADNVWPPCSKSARSQVSATLFYIRTITFVQAWICTDDMRASRLQAALLPQSKHWSDGRLICQTCSATPATGLLLWVSIKRRQNKSVYLYCFADLFASRPGSLCPNSCSP